MLAVEVMPGEKVEKPLEEALLFHTEAYGIVVNRLDRRMLMVSKEMPPKVDLTIDITKGTFMNWIMEAFSTLAQDENRVLRVIGKSSKDPTVLVEVLIDEAPMRAAVWEYSLHIQDDSHIKIGKRKKYFCFSLFFLLFASHLQRDATSINGEVVAVPSAKVTSARTLVR